MNLYYILDLNAYRVGEAVEFSTGKIVAEWDYGLHGINTSLTVDEDLDSFLSGAGAGHQLHPYSKDVHFSSNGKMYANVGGFND